MRNRTFPKENEKKLKETIRDLRSQVQNLETEIKFLHQELSKLIKPQKDKSIKDFRSLDEWKKDFVARFKKEVIDQR